MFCFPQPMCWVVVSVCRLLEWLLAWGHSPPRKQYCEPGPNKTYIDIKKDIFLKSFFSSPLEESYCLSSQYFSGSPSEEGSQAWPRLTPHRTFIVFRLQHILGDTDTDLSSPRPPPTVMARQIRMEVQGCEATRQPYQEKNLSRELITPLEHQRTANAFLINVSDIINCYIEWNLSILIAIKEGAVIFRFNVV